MLVTNPLIKSKSNFGKKCPGYRKMKISLNKIKMYFFIIKITIWPNSDISYSTLVLVGFYNIEPLIEA